VSKVPPIELVVLATDPRLDWRDNLLLERCLKQSASQFLSLSMPPTTDRMYGRSFRGGGGGCVEPLSREARFEEAMIIEYPALDHLRYSERLPRPPPQPCNQPRRRNAVGIVNSAIKSGSS
jgi:hypothetical protein